MSTSDIVVPFTVLKQKIEERAGPPEFKHDFSAETNADTLANALVSIIYKGLSSSNINPLDDENQELLQGVYDLIEAITQRHFGVSNNLNSTRDIQATHGEPFLMIGFAINEEGKHG